MSFGTLSAVEARDLGSELVVDAPAGTTVLSLDMVSDFDDDAGTLLIGGQVLAYIATDDDLETITLAAPLPFDAFADDFVQVIEAGVPAVEWRANVAIDDGDTVSALIPTPLIGYFTDGTPDVDQQVQIAWRGTQYEVTQQPDTPPAFDGGAVWNPHSFRNAAPATIPASDWTQITAWNDVETEAITIGAGYTVQIAGYYEVRAQAAFVSNATGGRRVRIILNGDTLNPLAFYGTSADPGSTATHVATSADQRFAEGDVVTVEVQQTSGAALDLTTGPGRTNFGIKRISI